MLYNVLLNNLKNIVQKCQNQEDIFVYIKYGQIAVYARERRVTDPS